MIGPPQRPPTEYPVRYIGSIGDATVWQDIHILEDVLIHPNGPNGRMWLLGWPGISAHSDRAAEWLAALTPAETCDLYATIEAAIANPPETVNDTA